MNFALSIIVLTLVVALICFYPLLRSVKAKEDKKRDELNKALYFSRLKEIDQDNQQGLVENVEQLKQELQKTLLEDIPQQETQTIDKNAKNYNFLPLFGGRYNHADPEADSGRLCWRKAGAHRKRIRRDRY